MPVGQSPGISDFQVFAPVRVAPLTGATALEAHQVSDHSHEQAGDEGHQHIPEEASHRTTSFTGGLSLELF